jgi:Sulfite exporter TauE/SafE
MTAVCVLSHRWLRLLTATRHADSDPRWTATLTTFAGLLLGVFVTLSSVGAGAIGMTALVLLYPRTPIARLVGSDIAHAVPLTLIAGVGHWLLGSVDWVLLGSLVIWLSAGHLLRQPSECAGAGQGVAAGPRDNPRHRWRAHAESLSIAKLVPGPALAGGRISIPCFANRAPGTPHFT